MIDLDTWEPGEDVDADDTVAVELAAARQTIAKLQAWVEGYREIKDDDPDELDIEAETMRTLAEEIASIIAPLTEEK